MGDNIFSLDIGTRNVVGILAEMEDETYKVIDYEIIEHPDRAMYDGQIHDIEKVSSVVRVVKERLEERNQISLDHVSIAAAGRALKTQKVFAENDIDSTKPIDSSLINSLELHGIQMAQKELESTCSDLESKYYCVGYTVMNYYLDEASMGNLKGHKGNKIGAEVLATFLPHVVVDSLYTVIHNVGLEVTSLTLEPIAAINIAIPPKFRLLNLALVDVGAGTSDIAITQNGTITSYAMVSFAGDKITESLSNAFLLDFVTAEKVKLGLNNKEHHRFNDIVGIEYDLKTEEIVSRVDDVINELSDRVADKIVEYNGKATSAVFCIGGGSQIPKFREYLAEKLQIPKERVVVRGTETLENLKFLCEELRGPEYITPLGIGYTSHKDKEQDFLKVSVNGKPIRLFNSKELSVSDALVLIGFNARRLIAKKGKSITIEINGEQRVINGGYGEPAKIMVNGKSASLDTKLNDDDSITIVEATHGDDAAVKLSEIVNINEKVVFNDKELNVLNHLSVNGESTNGDYVLTDMDKVNIHRISKVSELLETNNVNLDGARVFVNNALVNEDYVLKKNDIIEIRNNTVQEIQEKQEEIKPSKPDGILEVNVNGKIVELDCGGKKPIFVEIFNHIDFDIKKSNGILVLKLNGERANYTDVLKTGDVIEIYWR
ncbi:cell division FtsA domain-containing protein [Wukongibacter baidiensis]|uniref:cell division FtsA domain-containing protein n=1 Tax=Wukongibacter baidiensis TaxID=1723361 RepID=UPI003D7F8D69